MTAPTLSKVTIRLPDDGPRGTSPEYLRHQAVASLFRDQPEARPLHRVLAVDGLAEQLLVLARGVAERTDAIAPGRWVTSVSSKPFAPALTEGQRLDFDLQINATSVQTLEDGRKRRLDVWDIAFAKEDNASLSRDAVYEEWLNRQLHGAGLVSGVRIAARSFVRIRTGETARRTIGFVQTRVLGKLLVVQPQPLLEIVVEGLGRARAFGCGLTCLLPAGFLQRAPGPRLARTREG